MTSQAELIVVGSGQAGLTAVEPIHRREVTQSPGLYFLGLKNQYSRGSSVIAWVRHDAEFIVEEGRDRHGATHIDAMPPPAGRGAGTIGGRR